MAKSGRFWRNVVVIAVAHVALIAGLIRWSLAARASNPESIVWLGAAQDLAARESESEPSLPPKPEAPKPSNEDEEHEKKPAVLTAKSEIELPSPSPKPTPTAASTPKSTATPAPKPKATPRPIPKPTPKKAPVAKASPKPSPKAKPGSAKANEKSEKNEKSGGTGFFVSVPSEIKPHVNFIYGVSNAHVVQASSNPAPVIRSSVSLRPGTSRYSLRRVTNPTPIGTRKITERTPEEWRRHPDPAVDLAMVRLGGSIEHMETMAGVPSLPYSIPSSLLLSHEVINAFDIGPGDDVYMIGRSIHHDGRDLNQPTVRTGIISLMPDMIDLNDGGPLEEAFLIEMRSLSGYSGSPVLWTLAAAEATARRQSAPMATKAGPWPLGVDCIRYSLREPVYDESDLQSGYVKANSGLSMVIPAWKLKELRYLEEVVAERKNVLA